MDGAARERDRHDRAVVVGQVVDQAEVQGPLAVGVGDRDRADVAAVPDRHDVLPDGDGAQEPTLVPGGGRLEGRHVVGQHRVVVVECDDIAAAGSGEAVVERRGAARPLDPQHTHGIAQPGGRGGDDVLHGRLLLGRGPVAHHEQLEVAVILTGEAGQHVLQAQQPPPLGAGDDA